MKNKGRKFTAAFMAGLLCITVLSACSAAKKPDSGETTVSTETASSTVSSVSSEESGSTQVASGETSGNLNSDTNTNSNSGISLGEFTTQDINGETYTQDIFGDYDLTLVNVLATWCSPCVAELPDLEELRAKMADKGVNVVGVLLDVLGTEGEMDPESIERAKLLQEQTGVTFPILVPDSTYFNGRLIGIEALPETFFVDKNGNIVGETYSGSRGLEDWMEIVEKELASVKGE